MTGFLFRTSAAAGLVLAMLPPTAAPAGAQARPPAAEAWRDAFESSPVAYSAVDEAFKQSMMDKFHMTRAMVDALAEREVTGTLRLRLRVSAAGRQVRVRLSNEEGRGPLAIGGASLALAGPGGVRPGTLQRLTFGGAAATTIAEGAPLLSDPVDLPVEPGTELIVSVSLPGRLSLSPLGGAAMTLAPGDQSGQENLQNAVPATGRPLVTGVEVLAPRQTRVIAALGDSITDANHPRGPAGSWPEHLAARLAARPGGPRLALVNAGIGGNRVLGPGMGKAALARLDRDVLRIDGLAFLLVLEGTNDIGPSGVSARSGQGTAVTPDLLIAGYRQIIARAHARQVRAIFGTITPFAGAPSHSTPGTEAVRQAVNRWIRTSGEPDGVIDFDRALRDPAAPDRLLAAYDSGDHLHPGPAGYQAMAEAVDLGLFGQGVKGDGRKAASGPASDHRRAAAGRR